MSLRRIVSLTLFMAIALMLTTSIILFIVPQGRIAYWGDWQLWGLSKTHWGNLHTNAGFLMLIAASLHVYYNWRPITSYMKNKAREVRVFTPNFNAALAVTAFVAVFTLMELPPLSLIQTMGDTIKDNGAEKMGEPPYGHAEESGLRIFLRNVGLDSEVAQTNMAAAGIEVDDPNMVMADLAHANGMSPQALYEIMRGPEDQRSTEAKAIPTTMPTGSGRLTLEGFCDQYNRDLGEAVKILEAVGLQVDPQLSLKDIAADNEVEALDLLDHLREGFGE